MAGDVSEKEDNRILSPNSNYTVEAKVKLTEGNTSAGPCVRVKSAEPDPMFPSDGIEYVCVQGYLDLSASPATLGLRYRYYDSNPYNHGWKWGSLFSTSVSVSANEWHKISVQAIGNSFRCRLDDLEWSPYFPNTGYPAGMIGLRASGGASFDNVLVLDQR